MTLSLKHPSWADDTEVGAPVLNNAPGSWLEVIRAVCITGFNTRPVTSISVSAGVATATAADHGYTATHGKLLLISGASEPLLNGRKQPLSVTANSFTYAAPGVADGTYSGGITARRAPMGWLEVHTGTNVAMFKPGAAEASAMLYRINDSGADGADVQHARIFGVESATDVDTFAGQFPSVAFYLEKGANSAAAQTWVICGNERFLFLMPGLPDTQGPTNHAVAYLGDIRTYVQPDPFTGVVCGSWAKMGFSGAQKRFIAISISVRGHTFLSTDLPSFSSTGLPCIARDKTGTAPAQIVLKTGFSGEMGYLGRPSNTDVPIQPTAWLVEKPDPNANEYYRGEMPGLGMPLEYRRFVSKEVVPTASGLQYLAIRTNSGGASPGQIVLSLNDDWYD